MDILCTGFCQEVTGLQPVDSTHYVQACHGSVKVFVKGILAVSGTGHKCMRDGLARSVTELFVQEKVVVTFSQRW